MRLDQGPVFRKTIIPWYDLDAVCWCMIAVLAVVAAFGLVGLFVVLEHPPWNGHAWMPLLLVILCGAAILSASVRLARRYAYRYSR